MSYYFAYGSNMDPGRMKNRGAEFKNRKSGRLEGYKLVFNKMSADDPSVACANITKSRKDVVEGIIYDLDDGGLSVLDVYEGVEEGQYRRERVEVVDEDGNVVVCTTYISERIDDGIKPDREYMSHLLNGKEMLSEEYYDFLKNVETTD